MAKNYYTSTLKNKITIPTLSDFKISGLDNLNNISSYLVKTPKTKKTSTVKSIEKQVDNLNKRLEASGEDTDSRNAIEKFFNFREDAGFLENVGDSLERLSGLASVKAMIAGDPMKSVGQNAIDAFLGNQRYTGTDVLEMINPDTKYTDGLGKTLGGLAVDIFLDPATYLTLGASALAKSSASAGAKALGSVDDISKLSKTLKTTKTLDQATDLVGNIDKANDLLKASKNYRIAQTLDTIANPLSLIPTGVKKLGSSTFKGIEKVSPRTAESISDLGNWVEKTFSNKTYMKKHVPKAYESAKRAEALANASTGLVSSGSEKQAKLLQQMFNNIKKDPDKVFDIVNRDGTKATFSFKGMTDDAIKKALDDFAVNQIYFDRPTVIDESTIRSLTKESNKGVIALPVKSFKNQNDLTDLENLLKSTVDDPDLVKISPYVQESGKQSGFIIDIGNSNVKSFKENIQNITRDIDKQNKLINSIQDSITNKNTKITNANNLIKENNSKISDLENTLLKTTDSAQKDILTQQIGDLKRQTRVLKSSNTKGLSTLDNLNQRLSLEQEALNDLYSKQNQIDELFKTRELIPYDSPILDTPEMRQIADLQRGTMSMNLALQMIQDPAMKNLDVYQPYMHRQLTDESLAYIQSLPKKNPVAEFMTYMTDKVPSQATLSSKYGNFSPTEVNTMLGRDLFDSNVIASNLDMVKGLNTKNYSKELAKSLFSEPNDWVQEITTQRYRELAELKKTGNYTVVGAKDIINKLKFNDMLDSSEIQDIMKSIRGKRYLINNDAIDLFEKNAKLYRQLDNPFNKSFNKFMKYWKGGNLLSVGYHARNIFGAQTNMALAGMSLTDVAKYTQQAGVDLAKFKTKILPEVSKLAQDPDIARVFRQGTLDDIAKVLEPKIGKVDSDLFVEMFDNLNKGLFDLTGGQNDAIKKVLEDIPTSKVGQSIDKIQKINYQLGAFSDDMHRLASYRWASDPKNTSKLIKVGANNPMEFVHYAMFDFKSLSPTEQMTMVKIFPFYNFIKNNLSFQISNLMKNGQRYNTVAKAYKNLYSGQKISDNEVQDYVRDSMYIPIRQADGTIKVLKIAPPIQDATNIISWQGLLGASNPLIQYIGDRAYGKDLYTGKELSGDTAFNTQQLIDTLPYGRFIRQLPNQISNPLNSLITNVDTESSRLNNAYQELNRLNNLATQYRNRTGNSLPTLKDLGLD